MYAQHNAFVTEKKAPKKEFKNTPEEFPTLGGNNKKAEDSTLNFAEAAKKEEEDDEILKNKIEVNPGWVVMYRGDNNKTMYEYNEEDLKRKKAISNLVEDSSLRRDAVLEGLVSKWQDDRDEMNDRLDIFSPYYTKKSLLEDRDSDTLDDWGDSDKEHSTDDDDYGDY